MVMLKNLKDVCLNNINKYIQLHKKFYKFVVPLIDNLNLKILFLFTFFIPNKNYKNLISNN